MKNLKIGSTVIVSKAFYSSMTPKGVEGYRQRFGCDTPIVGVVVGETAWGSAVVKFAKGLGFKSDSHGADTNSVSPDYLTVIDLPSDLKSQDERDDKPKMKKVQVTFDVVEDTVFDDVELRILLKTARGKRQYVSIEGAKAKFIECDE